ncbi:hypothetical protein BD410DRAFT_803248 [Rickenella mellea]|uniref:AB hydrolase-1 domain-containing protein n=1 Tax=Rickenella mellea TaxID=50990 RepID=A0A4Y7Q6A1_9AGAM|nr:hypothetical protein BD410DRAFT_803248 [Rickenella mellea]
MAHFVSESFIFDPRPDYPFLVTAKRYTDSSSHQRSSEDAYTIFFMHGIGSHKEQWEPTIEHVWTECTAKRQIHIREMWSIDCPNHGEAAVLNEHTLQWGYQDYCKGVPAKPDFSMHRLIGVAHSGGAVALVLSQKYRIPNLFTTQDGDKSLWCSMILVEPMFGPQSSESAMKGRFIRGVEARRDIWPSESAALAELQGSAAHGNWDKRVMELYCKHWLRNLPTADYPNITEGVTLKFTKLQEIAMYRDTLGRARAYKHLHVACAEIPVHAIYGTVHDYIPAKYKEEFITVSAQGKLSSVQWIPGCGHLIVQIRPQGLAEAILADLIQTASASTGANRSTVGSKL